MKTTNYLKVGLLAIALPVLFTSCKKDFVCSCTYTTVLGTEETKTYPLENQTRPDAVENCENFEKNSSWETANCNL